MADKKPWTEVFVMPLVLALVGSLGTYFITKQQQANALTLTRAQASAATQAARADRQVKILGMFSDKITDANQNQRMLAVRLLRVLDDELAEKLAVAVSEGEPESSEVKKIADDVAAEAQARQGAWIETYVGSVANLATAREVGKQFEGQGYYVPEPRVMTRAPTSSQLFYFHNSETKEAEGIVEQLKAKGIEVELTYNPGQEYLVTAPRRHYQLRFATGEPPNLP